VNLSAFNLDSDGFGRGAGVGPLILSEIMGYMEKGKTISTSGDMDSPVGSMYIEAGFIAHKLVHPVGTMNGMLMTASKKISEMSRIKHLSRTDLVNLESLPEGVIKKVFTEPKEVILPEINKDKVLTRYFKHKTQDGVEKWYVFLEDKDVF